MRGFFLKDRVAEHAQGQYGTHVIDLVTIMVDLAGQQESTKAGRRSKLLKRLHFGQFGLLGGHTSSVFLLPLSDGLLVSCPLLLELAGVLRVLLRFSAFRLG